MISADDLHGIVLAKCDPPESEKIVGFVIKVEMPGVDSIDTIQIKRNRPICRLAITAPRRTLDGKVKNVSFVEEFDNNCCFHTSPTEKDVLNKATLINGVFTCEILREVQDI